MKIIRSTKCSLKYLTRQKQEQLQTIFVEYSKVVNFFINYFWNKKITKRDITKNIFNLPETWLSSRMKQVAAREALDMVRSTQEVVKSNKEQIMCSVDSIQSKISKVQLENTKGKRKARRNRKRINNLYCALKRNKMKYDMIQPSKPIHKGTRMCLSALIADLQECKSAIKFNAWLHLSSIGDCVKIDLPINFHQHFKALNKKGSRLNSYIITKDYVQFSFEIETGPKKEVKSLVGIDTGINALASLSTGEQFGKDIKENIQKIKRCKWGSKGHKRASKTLKYKISAIAKQVVKKADLVVVEKLKNLSKNTKLKGRLSKNIRSSVGSWNYSYWLKRLQMSCEDNRVSFRTVSPQYTSQKCFECGHTDKGNRNGEMFECRSCGHTGNADINAANNILERFLTGKYGSCYKVA